MRNLIAIFPSPYVEPYRFKNGIVDRLVYLNFPDRHYPIQPENLFSWFLIGVMILLLMGVLYVATYTNQLSDRHTGN